MFCPNRECVDFLETGAPAEYRDDVTTCPKCGSHLVSEAPAFQEAAVTGGGAGKSADIQVQILTELRRSRRFNMWYALGTVVVLVVVVIASVLHRRSVQPAQPAEVAFSGSWHAVFDLVLVGRTDEGLRMALAAYSMAPEYYYSNSSLSYVYLAKGDLRRAEEYALKAYLLLPSEENEKYLAAVRKRIAMESGKSPAKEGTR